MSVERKTVTIPEKLYKKIREYQHENYINIFSEAIRNLAAKGLEQEQKEQKDK